MDPTASPTLESEKPPTLLSSAALIRPASGKEEEESRTSTAAFKYRVRQTQTGGPEPPPAPGRPTSPPCSGGWQSSCCEPPGPSVGRSKKLPKTSEAAASSSSEPKEKEEAATSLTSHFPVFHREFNLIYTELSQLFREDSPQLATRTITLVGK